mgnify:CR=1 FL=1
MRRNSSQPARLTHEQLAEVIINHDQETLSRRGIPSSRRSARTCGRSPIASLDSGVERGSAMSRDRARRVLVAVAPGDRRRSGRRRRRSTGSGSRTRRPSGGNGCGTAGLAAWCANISSASCDPIPRQLPTTPDRSLIRRFQTASDPAYDGPPTAVSPVLAGRGHSKGIRVYRAFAMPCPPDGGVTRCGTSPRSRAHSRGGEDGAVRAEATRRGQSRSG